MLRAYRVVAAVALGAAVLLSLPFSALAAPPSRAWGVWVSDGTAWLAATPRDSPPDGSVVGWRFSEASDGGIGEPPGGELPSFEGVCGRETAGSGHKRVVVAVDFGDVGAMGSGGEEPRPGDRPPAQAAPVCVAGAEDATTAQLLAAAAEVRVDGAGGVVSVDGHVDDVARKGQRTDRSGPARAGRRSR
uniref:hypothetical protein n=1 Tax=Nonomuraea gerenzanensis TaxID=93944 RepID=UPI00287FBF06|nr:hypothetical protein [Nonomuraea gerenzanensis]